MSTTTVAQYPLTDPPSSGSPFDRIRRTRPDGSEYWSARDLQPLMGYSRWEDFLKIVQRAEASALNAGQGGFSAITEKPSSVGGRPREDYELTRFACYLAAMNGDPNMKSVAAAQAYFAVRTRQAETNTVNLTGPELMARALIEAQATLAAHTNKIASLEARTQADQPKVLFADAVATSKTSILVGELAKILKANGFDIGQNRLFALLRDEGYLIRRVGTDYNMPTQKAMDLGLFEIKETAVTHADGHVTVQKTPKITGKGQQYFISRYLKQVAR